MDKFDILTMECCSISMKDNRVLSVEESGYENATPTYCVVVKHFCNIYG